MNQHSQRASVEKWVTYTIKRFKEAQDSSKVRHTGALYNSFIENIVSGSDGNVISVEIKFKYYLRFLDMGVKKGVRLGSKYVKPRTRLYSKIKTSRVKDLADIMCKHYGIKSVGLIESNLKDLTINI